MEEILNRIEIWFKNYLPEVLANLNNGATENEIEVLENQI
jgi:cell wall assembly regulator SMI1